MIVLQGSATLHLGDEALAINQGDHIAFPAGEEIAYHIKNATSAPVTYLVFGERKLDDQEETATKAWRLLGIKQGFVNLVA